MLPSPKSLLGNHKDHNSLHLYDKVHQSISAPLICSVSVATQAERRVNYKCSLYAQVEVQQSDNVIRSYKCSYKGFNQMMSCTLGNFSVPLCLMKQYLSVFFFLVICSDFLRVRFDVNLFTFDGEGKILFFCSNVNVEVLALIITVWPWEVPQTSNCQFALRLFCWWSQLLHALYFLPSISLSLQIS